jgi:DNA modification methylase
MNPLNQILQGDCITVMRSLASASVDFGLTDPPYLGSPDDLFKSYAKPGARRDGMRTTRQ